jgi:hypothetical protein
LKHETIEKNRIKRFNENSELNISDVSSSLYPTDEQILEMVEDFTKDLNVSNTVKKATICGL